MGNTDARPKFYEKYENGQRAGALRQQLMRDAIAQCNKAIKQHFYVEAVLLLESLIGDRVESILYEISGGPRLKNNALGPLIIAFNEPRNGITAIKKVDKNKYPELWSLLRKDKHGYLEKSFEYNEDCPSCPATTTISTIPSVDAWKDDRNMVAHALAKLTPIAEGIPESFAEKLEVARMAAIKGLALFRELDKSIKAFRKDLYVVRERTLRDSTINPVDIVPGKGIRIKVKDDQKNWVLDELISASKVGSATRLEFKVTKNDIKWTLVSE